MKWLSNPENPLPRWQGSQFFFQEGIAWTRGANHVPIKAAWQEKCVFDVNAMRLTPISSAPIPAHPLLAVFNSDVFSFTLKKFVAHTWMAQINDLRICPVVVPRRESLGRLATITEKGIDLQRKPEGEDTALDQVHDEANAAAEDLFEVAGLGPFEGF